MALSRAELEAMANIARMTRALERIAGVLESKEVEVVEIDRYLGENGVVFQVCSKAVGETVIALFNTQAEAEACLVGLEHSAPSAAVRDGYFYIKGPVSSDEVKQ